MNFDCFQYFPPSFGGIPWGTVSPKIEQLLNDLCLIFGANFGFIIEFTNELWFFPIFTPSFGGVFTGGRCPRTIQLLTSQGWFLVQILDFIYVVEFFNELWILLIFTPSFGGWCPKTIQHLNLLRLIFVPNFSNLPQTVLELSRPKK